MNVAFIPVRGGSKSIPLKNIMNICGKPLVFWTIKAACECSYIDKVYVSTDNDRIMETVTSIKKDGGFSGAFKIEAIGRSKESALDNASTEFAMLEFADNYEFENIVLIQATSPLLRSDDIERGFKEFFNDNTDSVLSVVRQKRFTWKVDDEGFAQPTNYNMFKRPRRQEFDGYFVENGAFYITSKTKLIESQNRISGNIKVVEMSEDTYYEVDEPSDWKIIELFMNKGLEKNTENIPVIKAFLTDCDGCLTDGGMYYSEKGDELKKFNTKDGMAFKLLKEKGIITGIITGENVDLNRRRAEKLHMDILESGCKDKLSAIKKICKDKNILLENVCYVGDDINDQEVIEAVGYGCCPVDAIASVKAVSKYVSGKKGGEGVIRDIVEHLMLD